MSRVFKALNNYLFDEDSISLSDALWFYFTTGFMLIVGVIFTILNITSF